MKNMRIGLGLIGLVGTLLAQSCSLPKNDKDESKANDNISTGNGGKGDASAQDDGSISSGENAGKSTASPGGAGSKGGSVSIAGAGGSGNADSFAGAGGSEPKVVALPTKACQGIDSLVPTMTLSGNIGKETTLSGVIAVTKGINVTGSVKIDPGTVFIMAANTYMDIGWNGARITVTASGNADKPIQFCGQQAKAGFWRNVIFGGAVTPDSVFEHVIVSDAGQEGAALVVNSRVNLTKVEVQNALQDGVRASAFGDNSSSLLIYKAGRDAVVLTSPLAVHTFPKDSTFTENANNWARLTFDSIQSTTTFANIGIPYLQSVSAAVHAVQVTFEAGVEMRFAADTLIEFGWNGNRATLTINGTSAAPVVFRGEKETKGYYKGIYINNSVDTESKISNLRLSHAGALDSSALSLSASITVQDLTLTDNKTPLVINAPLMPASKNVSVSGSDVFPVRVAAAALTGLPKGGRFTGNAKDQIDTNGATLKLMGTIPNLGVPYFLNSNFALKEGSDVDIEAGTTFIVYSGAFIEVGWNGNIASFSAIGTADAPIVFRGKDDTKGSWGGIAVRGSATADCKLDYVQLENAGLTLGRAISVTNSKFSKSASFGIVKTASDTTDYATSNTFLDNARGNIGNL